MRSQGIRALVLFVSVFVGAVLPAFGQTVTVSNVAAEQWGGYVWVTYDLAVVPAGPVAVSLAASDDGGLTYNVTPAALYGDFGAGVAPGTGRTLVWQVYADLPEQQIAEAAVRVDTIPAAGGGGVPESNLFTVDTRLASLFPVNGRPFDDFDHDQDGCPDPAQDYNGDGVPDAFADTDGDGSPDGYQDGNGDGLMDAFADLDGDGLSDFFTDRYALYSPTHPDSAMWYFSPDVVVDYSGYMPGASLYGYLWVMDQTPDTVVDYNATFRAAGDAKSVSQTLDKTGTWYFHIAAVGNDRQVVAGSQANLRVNAYLDGFAVTSASHPDSETPSLNKVFESTVKQGNSPGVWSKMAGEAGWSARSGHQTVEYQNKLWVMGGYGSRYKNDVWSSVDGKTWVQETAAAGWSARSGHQTVVFQNKLWVLGGDGINDVWSSADGKTWVQETATAGWSVRYGHQAVVFQNKLWVLGGGVNVETYKNDVWSSVDGKTWVQETAAAGWSAGYYHQVVVFQDKLWVLGRMRLLFPNERKNDVWSSVDGKTWVQETAAAGWSGRYGQQAVAFKNKLWVLGGDDGSYRNDVWSSVDGKTWVEEATVTGWSGRYDHQVVVFQNKLWVLGGNDGSYRNDVWVNSFPLPIASIHRYYYRVDKFPDTAPEKGDSFSLSPDITITPGFAPDTYWFHVAAVDAAGHLSAPAHYQFIVEDAPPAVTSPTHPNENIPGSGTQVIFNWTDGGVPDVVKYYYAWGTDGNATPSTATTENAITFDCVAPGTYYFAVQSEDTWGFKSPVARRKATVGTTGGPVIASSSHPNPGTAYALRDVTLSWTPAANSGAPYYYAWDRSPYTVPTGGSASTAEAFLTARSNLATGRWFLHLRATDSCGNLTAPAHFAVRIRQAKAPVVVVSPTANKNNIVFNWTDPDGFATGAPKFFIVFDQNPSTVVGTASPNSTSLYTWAELGKPEGLYYFHIAGQDTHGNLSAQADYAIWVGDTMVGLSAPSESTTKTGPVYYTVTYPGASAVTLSSANITLNKTGSANGTVTVEAGANAVEKRVRISNCTGDGTLGISIAAGTAGYAGGKSAPAVGPSGVFTVDNLPPQVTITGPTPAATAHGPVTYTITYQGATDILLRAEDITLTATPSGAAGAELSLSGDGVTRTVTLSNVWGQGALGFTVAAGTATDDGGNTAAGATSATVSVDGVPPTGSVVINGGAVLANSVTAALALSYSDGTGSGVTQMRFSNNGSAWSTWEAVSAAKTWAMASGDGAKTVYVQFQDGAGNVSSNATDTITLDATPPTGTVVINGGDAHTTSANTTLALTANDGGGSGVTQMRLGNDGTSWAAWEAFSATKPWTLASGDGEKTVYVQFQDAAGNVSSNATDTIVLDTTAPTGTVVINGGAAYTNSTSATLTLTSSDGSGAGGIQMRLSADGSVWGAWEAVAVSKPWTLSSGDGTKTVYVQYKDVLGNTSGNLTDSIILDQTVPAVTLGTSAPNPTNAAFTVAATFTETVTGFVAGDVTVANGAVSAFTGSGTAYQWTVTPAADGAVTVSVAAGVCVDVANNGNTASNMLTVSYDKTPPTGTVVINGGASHTGNTTATLTLTANDGSGSGVTQMRLGNDGTTWGAWEAFAATKLWTLSTGDGTKTVYVQFEDGAGNVSANATDTITLDTTAPTGTVVINGGAAYTNSTSATLTLTSSDGSGAGGIQMRLSADGTTWGAWEAFATSKPWTLSSGDGTKTVYVQYKDALGNTSGSVTDTIILDQTAPGGTVIINNGAAVTNSIDAALALTAGDGTGSGGIQMRLSNDGADWGAWEAFAAAKPWTLEVGDGVKTVHVQYKDALGNTSGTITDTIELDQTAPGVTLATSAQSQLRTAFTVTAVFTESVTGFAEADVVVDNGTVSEFTGDGANYEWTVTPTADGTVTVSVSGAVCVDRADNENTASNVLSLLYDTTAPTGTVVINDSAAYTNSTSATLTLTSSDGSGSGGIQMRLSADGTTWGDWEAFATSKPWTLSGGDGTKTVHVQYKDALGNTSGNLTDSIILDQTAPDGTVLINNGAAVTNSIDAALALTAGDGTGSGGIQMRLSNDGADWGAWEAFAAAKPWTLEVGDGVKTVHVQYKDALGNTSGTITDTIELDQTAPGVTLATSAQSQLRTAFTVTAVFTESVTGFAEADVVVDNGTVSEFTGDGANYEWTVTPTADGTVTVSVSGAVCVDRADNENTASNVLSLLYDTTAPTGTVVINGGAAYTNSTSATLTLTSSDGSGAGSIQMRLSADGTTWGTWEAFATSKPWTLSGGDGTKTVHVQYKDVLGNTSGSVTDTIILDQTAPAVTLGTSAPNPTNAAFTVTATFTETVTGFVAGDVTVANGTASAFTGSGAAYQWTVTPAADGPVTVSVAAGVCVDVANNGNTASNGLARTHDATAPSGTVVINGGASHTKNPAVTLALTAGDGTGTGVTQMRLSADGTDWGAWEPFAATKPWTVSAGDGVKTVHAQFKDGAGNVSATATDTITLDTTGPTGSVVINGGAAVTRELQVEMTINADDGAEGAGGIRMRYSQDGSAWTEWTDYAQQAFTQIAPGDGDKILYVQFTDRLGNLSPGVSDTIVLDTRAPRLALSSAAGDPLNGPFTVTAVFDEVVVEFGLEDVTVANGAASALSGEGATRTFTVTPAAEGLVTVNVGAGVCADLAGNPNEAAAELHRTYDATPPNGNGTLPGGDTSDDGEITITISGDGTVVEVRFSNDGANWSDWMPYGGPYQWQLADGPNGPRTVYIQMRDAAGNITSQQLTVVVRRMTAVPDITGRPRAEAEALLSAAGLAVGAVTEEYNKKIPKGTLLRQEPAAGTQVEVGSAVAFVVSKGKDKRGLFSCGAGAGGTDGGFGSDLMLLGGVAAVLFLASRRGRRIA